MLNSKNNRYAWLLVTLLALAPIWIVGMFDRGYWTPDEPREADIAWRMSTQADRTLPQLADTRFLEKPPLSYWMSAAAMNLFGDSPAAARVPNLFYAIISTIAIGMLVFTMAGATAAAIAAITAGSAFNSYQVAIWLAPDAGLVAGCAVALLGLYRGYVAAPGRSKLLWYTVMHVGALLGFMAKSGPGWIVPGLTLLILIAWEKRWDELKRWQLWIGLTLQLIVIGIWVTAVWHQPEGVAALQVLFWNNLAGRFTDLHTSGALNYALAHKNWPCKYLIELPYYLFPWTLLVVAALHRAWSATRVNTATGTAWRFAVAASLPFLILLSLASTARSIYAAPALLGLCVLVGLWSSEFGKATSRLGQLAVSATRYAVCIFALLILAMLAALDVAEPSRVLGIAIVIVIVVATLAARSSAQSQRHHAPHASLGWAYVVYAASLVVGGSALFPQFDRWQNLGALAQAINRDTNGHALAILQPDETTIAILDHQLKTPYAAIEGTQQDQTRLAAQWFQRHPDNGLILIDLPGHATGNLTQLMNRFHQQQLPGDGMLLILQQANIAHLVARYDLPHGRRYALVEGVHAPVVARVTTHVAPAS